jgi:pimeloyl-ACP methyl ester carboxylesterase
MRMAALALLILACDGEHDAARGQATVAPLDTGRIAVPGSTLFYERAGAGRTVVLLHGGNLDRRMWDAEFLALQRDYQVIRYDARGYGRSGRADTAFAAHDDLLALLQQLNVPRAALVGLSLGGRIAMDFALAHPDRVERLVLVAPGISGGQWADDGDTAWLSVARRAAKTQDSVAVARAWLGSAYIRTALRDSATAARVRHWVEDQSSFWAGMVRHQDLERAAEPAAASRLAELRMPVLLIVGAADTPFIHDVARAINAQAPNVERVDVPGVGHMVNLEAPGPFLAVVSAFLAK